MSALTVSARATLASRFCSNTWIKRVAEFRFCGLLDKAVLVDRLITKRRTQGDATAPDLGYQPGACRDGLRRCYSNRVLQNIVRGTERNSGINK